MRMIFNRVVPLVIVVFSLVLASCKGVDRDRKDKSTAVPSTAVDLSISPSDVLAPDQPVLPIFMPQGGTPAAVHNFIYPDSGCAWSGVAGQVFGLDGKPVSGLVVQLNGSLEGVEISHTALTGSSQVLGPGGFDISLADYLAASTTLLSLQLFDLGGNSLSRPAYFGIYADCEMNLIILNFTQVAAIMDIFFPLAVQQTSFP